MTIITPGSATLPVGPDVQHRAAPAHDAATRHAVGIVDSEQAPLRSWNPIALGAGAAGLGALGVGGALVAARMPRVGAPLAVLGAAGTAIGAAHLRAQVTQPDVSSQTFEAAALSDSADQIFIRYGDPRDPRLAPSGSDRTNLPAQDFTRSGTAQSREGVVQVRSDQGDHLDLGSGWVVRPGLVVTNHHVVRDSDSARSVVARDHDGVDRAATVIASDPAHDLALLAVPELDDAPLPLDDVVERGERARITGYPRNAFTETLATAYMGADVTYNGADRDGIMFAGRSAPGASGGPIINASGEVVATMAAGGSDVTTAMYSGPVSIGITNDDVRDFVDAATTDEAHPVPPRRR